ncbi:MAG: copper(I)-binding protein [Cellvibrionaceae bacterium]|jgi:copper(I)-binding protein
MTVLFFLQFGFAGAEPHDNKKIHISNAWSPAAPPVAPTRVGYFSITNISDKTISIVDVTSPLFAQANFHETRIVNGIASMSAMGEIVLKPKQALMFEPSGMHLMLMNAKAGLAKAKAIPLMLSLDDGQQIHLNLIVTAPKETLAAEIQTMNQSAHAHH